MGLLLLLMVVLGAVGEEEGGLAHLQWTPVADRASLTAALDCNSCLLGLRITNGTEWLQIGGRDDTFLPIVTQESQVAATSDLSLASALAAFGEKRASGSQSGLHISFLTPSIVESSLDVIGSLFPQPNLAFPILISVVVLDSSEGRSSEPLMDGSDFLEALTKKVPGAVPVLSWATFHGLDPVWARIGQEGILKSFQTARLEGLLDSLYKEPESLPEQEVRFAELLDQKLERTEGSSFTALAVGQLVAAIKTNGHHKFEVSPWAPRKPYRPPRRDPVRALLPEYYLKTSKYTAEAVDEMTSLSAKFNSNDSPLGFALRAGLIANQNCPTLKKLLQSRPSSFLTVELHPTDRESRKELKTCTSGLPKDRVLFLMPKEEDKGGKGEGEEDRRIPEPRTAVTGGASKTMVTFLPFALFALLML